MATRLAHISDLHFPAKSAGQVTALAQSLAEAAPDLLVVSGDLTRSGTQAEFQEAKAFISSLGVAAMVLPGNHDIPVPGLWARLRAPFRRFDHFFPDVPPMMETPDLVLVGLNTAVGWQPGLDWSLGYAVGERVEAAAALVAAQGPDRLRIVVGHHPLHQHPSDPVRSRTFGGEQAFDRLCSAGMDLYLHGHLHRSGRRCFAVPPGSEVCEVCANTALANRERGGPAGYNILDVSGRRWDLTVVSWQDGGYRKPV